MNKLTKNKYKLLMMNKSVYVFRKNATKLALHLLLFKDNCNSQKIILWKCKKLTFYWVFNNYGYKIWIVLNILPYFEILMINMSSYFYKIIFYLK